jgi:ribonuclease P protein component
MKPHGLPRAARILLTREFRTVFDRGRSRSDGTFIVYARPRGKPGPSRLGVVVGRRFGGAVLRNAWKRRARETFRLARARLPGGHDFIVLPAAPGRVPSPAEADTSLVSLAALAVAEYARRGPK